jgi:predicted nuclease with TOPRIM domain
VEKLKNAKLVREWQHRKRHYQTHLETLLQEDSQKDAVLNRLEGELDTIRTKLQDLCQAFTDKEQECDDLRVENTGLRGRVKEQEALIIELREIKEK